MRSRHSDGVCPWNFFSACVFSACNRLRLFNLWLVPTTGVLLGFTGYYLQKSNMPWKIPHSVLCRQTIYLQTLLALRGPTLNGQTRQPSLILHFVLFNRLETLEGFGLNLASFFTVRNILQVGERPTHKKSAEILLLLSKVVNVLNSIARMHNNTVQDNL